MKKILPNLKLFCKAIEVGEFLRSIWMTYDDMMTMTNNKQLNVKLM